MAVKASAQLRMSALLNRGLKHAPKEEIVSVGHHFNVRQTYEQTFSRAARLAHALSKAGVTEGACVATLMGNSHWHLEAYLAVPLMGAVLHALNYRLAAADFVYVVNHAEDVVVLVDEDLLPVLEPHLKNCLTVRKVIVAKTENGRSNNSKFEDWEDFISQQPTAYSWPDLSEHAPFGLCYTSGTTGNPKGVMYSHRSTYLHTMAQAATDTVGLSATDSVLQIVPMFHVLGWGYPYTATMLGSKQVLVHGSLEPGRILDFIEQEEISFTAAVPTIWQGVRAAVEAQPERWNTSTLQRINCGASAPAHSLIKWYWEKLNVEMIQSWGMTETNPLGVTSRRLAKRSYLKLSLDEQLANVSKTGLTLPGIELEIVDDEGNPLPHDGETPGNLLIRGPWVCSEYYRDPQPDKFLGDWLNTGDIAKIDAEEYLIISDRSKDLIKSGGEWISSIDLENHILGLPGVRQAAVVAQAHPKWDERPVALVVKGDNAAITQDSILRHCATRFAKWQLPDEVIFVEELPINSTGKIDKKTIRANLSSTNYQLPDLR